MSNQIKEYIRPEYEKAVAFCKAKSLEFEPLNYALTVHNTRLKVDTHHIFRSGQEKHYIKVQIGGEVTEWYDVGTYYEGEKVSLISMLPDGTKTGVYRKIENGVVKTPLDSNNAPTVSNFGSWFDIPKELREKADYFNHKHAILVWSDKSYGLILEYNRFLL